MEATQFWKNGRLLPHSPSPLEHPKKNNPATLCQASLILGCIQSSFPSKIPSVGKHRQLQHNHPDIPEEEVRAREPEIPSFISNFLAHNSIHSGGIQLLSQSHPSLFTIASGNLLLCPPPPPAPCGDLIRLSLYH